MIVYGWNSKHLGEQKLEGATCPNCEGNSIHAQGQAKYFHVFWIPLFPYGKKLTAHCDSCGETFSKKGMTPKMKDKLGLVKSAFKTPIYLFSGSVLIAAVVGWIFYSASKHKENVALTIQDLQPDDVLLFKGNGRNYNFAKITEHRSDTVFFVNGNYYYEGGKPSRYDYEKEVVKVQDFFDTQEYFLTQKEIDSLYASEEIVDILTVD